MPPDPIEPDNINPDESQDQTNLPQPTPQTIPKNKEEWDKLAKEDQGRWISLTQMRMDQAIRQQREIQTKLMAEQTKVNNLQAELENYKREEIKKTESEPKPFSRENMPQTKDQWDQLWIEDPNLADDLRFHKNEQDKQNYQKNEDARKNFSDTWDKCVLEVSDNHPDMFVTEKDETGQPLIKDGKPVFKRDQFGFPIPDLESEKAKIWIQVWNEDESGYSSSKFGPRNAMLGMERKLLERGKQKMQEQESKTAGPDQRGVMPGGVNPPVTAKVSFNSNEERESAQKSVNRGYFRSLEEYCQWRDTKQKGIYDEGNIPEFKK